jgi:hypothetical protein
MMPQTIHPGTTLSNIVAEIYDETSATKRPTIRNTCATLAPRRSCQLYANAAFNLAYSCRAVVSSKANLSGRLEVRASTGELLASEMMR